ncbi:MAG: Ig-like domain-containing protein, partial [Acidobacteriaceae bacterium]|nr:Ig-like domain-containing protein [Acidobacteriaceae bacterium]
TQTVGAVGETGQFLAIGTYSATPLTVDLTDQVQWLSSDVQVGTINSAGLATAVGTGESTITAIANATDGSAITATATFQWPPNQTDSGSTGLDTLAVYGAGSGSGTVTGPDAINCSYPGASPASPGAGCTGTFPVGTVVTLTAAPATGSVFHGWSNNCTPVPGNSNQCTITVNNNTSVGAIFDPQ